jgi:hypothetical protein
MIPRNLHQNEIVQLCWVVPNLDTAARHWASTTGAGPFFVFDDAPFENGKYRGAPGALAPFRAAIGYLGDLQIELVEPKDSSPGLWTDVVPTGRAGLHHLAVLCRDFEAERRAAIAGGAQILFEGVMKGAPTCYLDTLSTLGFLIQLTCPNPAAEAIFELLQASSLQWDGSKPIRSATDCLQMTSPGRPPGSQPSRVNG